MDLAEQGMAKFISHNEYLRVPASENMRYNQIHKLKGKKEFIMFQEYEDQPSFSKAKLYARKVNDVWYIYPCGPTDPGYNPDGYLFVL